MKFERPFFREKARTFSLNKGNHEEKELKLDDYTNYFNSRVKVVSNSNKIQLYQAEKMANYYRAKPKNKLQLNLWKITHDFK